MTSYSLSKQSLPSNPSNVSNFNYLHDDLFILLSRVKALVQVTLLDSFHDLPKDVKFDYSSLLDDIVDDAIETHHQLTLDN